MGSQHMKKEQEFNTWIRKQFYEATKPKGCVVQRIENTTSNGVPDIMVITQDLVFLIESKFETTNVRAEQKVFQINVNEVSDSVVCVTLSAYPKTKRLVVSIYDRECIRNKPLELTFTLDNEGFLEFYNFFLKAESTA